MTQIKTLELTGDALDWAVGVASGYTVSLVDYGSIIPWRKRLRPAAKALQGGWYRLRFSTDWNDAGRYVIEPFQLELTLISCGPRDPDIKPSDVWCGFRGAPNSDGTFGYADKPLTALLRCFVRSEMGDNINIPEALS